MDCIEWTGYVGPNGYPVKSTPDGNRMAHRVALEDLGVNLKGLEIHHKCRNRKCINPEHLQVLTRKEHIELHLKEDGHYQSLSSTYQLITKYIESLPNEYLQPVSYRNKGRTICTSHKSLRVPSIAASVGESEWTIRKVLKEHLLYQSLLEHCKG